MHFINFVTTIQDMPERHIPKGYGSPFALRSLLLNPFNSILLYKIELICIKIKFLI